jgi:hypothetical protein
MSIHPIAIDKIATFLDLADELPQRLFTTMRFDKGAVIIPREGRGGGEEGEG